MEVPQKSAISDGGVMITFISGIVSTLLFQFIRERVRRYLFWRKVKGHFGSGSNYNDYAERTKNWE